MHINIRNTHISGLEDITAPIPTTDQASPESEPPASLRSAFDLDHGYSATPIPVSVSRSILTFHGTSSAASLPSHSALHCGGPAPTSSESGKTTPFIPLNAVMESPALDKSALPEATGHLGSVLVKEEGGKEEKEVDLDVAVASYLKQHLGADLYGHILLYQDIPSTSYPSPSPSSSSTSTVPSRTSVPPIVFINSVISLPRLLIFGAGHCGVARLSFLLLPLSFISSLLPLYHFAYLSYSPFPLSLFKSVMSQRPPVFRVTSSTTAQNF